MQGSQEYRPLIIIPAFNARQSLPGILDPISSAGYECLIVNDGSSDGLVRSDVVAAHYLAHKENLGKGAALRSGLNWAWQKGFSHAITLDADGQHPPERLADFIRKASVHPEVVVLGKRHWNLANMPFHRILSNSMTSMMLSLRCGKSILDSQGGFWVYPLKHPRLWDLEVEGFQFESAVLLRAARMGYRFAHVPIPVIYGDEDSQIQHFKDTLRFVRLFLRSFLWLNP